MSLLDEVKVVESSSVCLSDHASVNAALDRVAAEITRAMSDANPVVLCVMTGGVVTTGQLLPRLHFPLQLDYVHASRYGSNLEGGELTWLHYPSVDLCGRVVLLVDDILDRGDTLSALRTHCLQAGASQCYSAVLVNKLISTPKPISADFVGVDIEDKYLFGQGMDYKGYLRNWPGIYACQDISDKDE